MPDLSSLSAVFGPDWQQQIATSPNGRLEVGGLVLVPNTDASVDAQTGAVTGTGKALSYTVFNGADGGKTNWLFDPSGKFQNTYAGNNPFTWKDIAASAAMVGLGMISGGALSGMASGVGALGGIAGVGSDVAGLFGAGGATAGDTAVMGAAGGGGIAPSVALTPGTVAAGSQLVPEVMAGGGALGAAGGAAGTIGGAGGVTASAAGGGGVLSQIGSALGSAAGGSSWLPALSTLGGALLNRNATNSAAGAQAGAAQAGIDETHRQFDLVRGLLQPYVDAGSRGLAGYEGLAGTRGADAQTQAIQQLQGTPMWQALVGAGDNAILQNAAATGGLRGGNTQDALAKQRALLLTDQVNQQLGRYGALASMGQNSAAGVGTAAMNTGTNVANLLQTQGAANAGGILAGNNAIVGALGGLAGMYSSYPRAGVAAPQQQITPGTGGGGLMSELQSYGVF